MTPDRLRSMTYDELEAAGLDDCGLPLDECPGLPPPGPWRGWTSRRRGNEHQAAGGRRTASVQPIVIRSRRPRARAIFVP